MNKSIHSIVILLALALVVPAAYGESQPKRKSVSHGRRHAQPIVVQKLPATHQRVVARGKSFFFSSGIFYESGPLGFLVVAAPLGARISVLPRGHSVRHIGGLDYFYYYGTYYRWLPEEKAYEVAEPTQELLSSDVAYLVNGEVLHGQFVSGDASSVRFAVGDEIHHLPLDEIVSIELEPPIGP